MRQHSTTTYFGTYVRLGIAILLSVLAAVYVPYYGSGTLDNFFSFSTVNTGILYAIVIGFLMMIAMNRKQALDTHISLELNKLRRLYHLSRHIYKLNPEAKTWFNNIDKAITNYLKAFGKRDFSNYEEGNTLHRKITYNIYQLPLITKDYNLELYGSLLDASASVTEAREHIRSIKDASIGYFQWLSTASITILFGLIVVAASPQIVLARIITGAVIFNLFLMIQLIFEYDQANPNKRKYYASLYVNNEKLMKAKDV